MMSIFVICKVTHQWGKWESKGNSTTLYNWNKWADKGNSTTLYSWFSVYMHGFNRADCAFLVLYILSPIPAKPVWLLVEAIQQWIAVVFSIGNGWCAIQQAFASREKMPGQLEHYFCLLKMDDLPEAFAFNGKNSWVIGKLLWHALLQS